MSAKIPHGGGKWCKLLTPSTKPESADEVTEEEMELAATEAAIDAEMCPSPLLEGGIEMLVIVGVVTGLPQEESPEAPLPVPGLLTVPLPTISLDNLQ